MADVRMVPLIGEPGRVEYATNEPMTPDNPNVPKGDRTWNFVFDRTYRDGEGRCMIAWRRGGEAVGDHFHSRVPGKDPEVFVFLAGDVDIHLTDVYGNTRTLEISVPEGSAPRRCTIPPYILHSFEIMSPLALFIEFQEKEFDPEDTFPAEMFPGFAAQFR